MRKRPGTPNNIDEAIANALREIDLSSTAAADIEAIKIIKKHIRDRLAHSFGKAMLTASRPDEIKALWNDIFP